MVNIIAKVILVGIVGIGALQISGQAEDANRISQQQQIDNNQLAEKLKEKIEKSIKESEDMQWMTSQNIVLEVQYQLEHVTVNLAPDMTGYGGGTHTEYMLAKLIMDVVFDSEEVEILTILVDGKEDVFPEGSDYSYCTRAHYQTYYADEGAER